MPRALQFNVDLSDTFAEFTLNRSQSEALAASVLNQVTAEFMRVWKSTARRGLGSTGNRYSRSIIKVSRGRLKNAVVLTDSLSNMLEAGRPPFDMKRGFLNSPKAKRTAKGGKYLTIPFRFATAGAGGFSEVFSGVLPTGVQKAAKAKAPARTGAGGIRITGEGGLKLTEIPEAYRVSTVREDIPGIGGIGEQYISKSTIFEGLQRSAKTYEGGTQGTYVTMRRVSDKSDANSWIHPGLQARNYAQKAWDATDFDTITNNAIDSYLAAL